LSWTNLPANVGSDVWVDVWFGTDSGSLAQVVTGGENRTSVTVSAPVGGTYYWRIDSYLNGSPSGAPLEGSVFIFYVVDTDGDGMPDDFELAHTSPPSPTALNPGDDLENGGAGDGLTNLEEYELGTDPTNPEPTPQIPIPTAIRSRMGPSLPAWDRAHRRIHFSPTPTTTD